MNMIWICSVYRPSMSKPMQFSAASLDIAKAKSEEAILNMLHLENPEEKDEKKLLVNHSWIGHGDHFEFRDSRRTYYCDAELKHIPVLT